MRLFNRDISRTLRRLPEAHHYLGYIVRCFITFKKPLAFVRAYLSGSALPGGVVEFRNGSRIYLSNHSDDVITVFAIYIRRDYGRLPAGSVVVDIGANIGVFALYAACQDAHTVLAYEPNGQAYDRLVQNIRANKLEHVIFPFRLAVTGQAGEKVRFPVAASAYNAIVTDDAELARGAYEWVKTTDLRRIVEPIQRVDILKMRAGSTISCRRWRKSRCARCARFAWNTTLAALRRSCPSCSAAAFGSAACPRPTALSLVVSGLREISRIERESIYYGT